MDRFLAIHAFVRVAQRQRLAEAARHMCVENILSLPLHCNRELATVGANNIVIKTGGVKSWQGATSRLSAVGSPPEFLRRNCPPVFAGSRGDQSNCMPSPSTAMKKSPVSLVRWVLGRLATSTSLLRLILIAPVVCCAPLIAHAWTNDESPRTVVMVGAHTATWGFLTVAEGIHATCASQTLYFDFTSALGKAMYATLIAGKLSGQRVRIGYAVAAPPALCTLELAALVP